MAMNSHGHAKADHRNLALHRAALAKLERNPQLLTPVLALLDRWLKDEAQRSSWPHLHRWRALLTQWPFLQMASCVLDPEGGQVLRQCSPLGPVLSPQERWAAFKEADHEVREAEEAIRS